MSDQTAYEQSITAAQAMMQSAQREQQEQEKANQYKAMHKKAFRVAYDLLTELYPIGKEPEDYWKFAANRVAVIYSENKDNKLCELLMKAVWEYAEGVWKEREERNSEKQ